MPSPIDAPAIDSLDTPKSVTLIMSVTSTNPEAEAYTPSFASVTLTSSLLGRLDELDMGRRQLAASEIRIPADIQWGPGAVSSLEMVCPELVLRGESTVWFSDTPRHSEYCVKSQPLDLEEIRRIYDRSSRGQVVFMTTDTDVRDAHAAASLAEVQANYDTLAIRDVIEDVRERAKKYGFQPDEHTAREAAETSAELLGLTLSPAQIDEACAQLCGRETPSTPAADDPLRLYEVTAVGFDGGSDDTDDHVLWVLAPSAEVVQDAIQDTGATFCGEVSGKTSSDLADFKLPAQSMQLASALLEKASEHRNQNRQVG